VLALSLIDNEHAAPGTQVELAWGEHPGGDVDPEADFGFTRIRTTVQPSPYNEYARTKYRADAATA
jgi:vanillate/3-O-methylgallate O-demethylase